MTLCHPKIQMHTKFVIPTSNNIGEMLWTQIFKTRSEVKVIVTQKMVRDTLSSQDASTHLIWNSFLKEYRSYALDLMPILETRSEVKVTVTKSGTGQSVIPRCIHTPNCNQRCIYTPNLEFLPQRI